jgi:hypothetical protein
VVYTCRWWMYAVDIHRMAAVQIHYGQTPVVALNDCLLTTVQLEAWLDRMTNNTTARLDREKRKQKKALHATVP